VRIDCAPPRRPRLASMLMFMVPLVATGLVPTDGVCIAPGTAVHRDAEAPLRDHVIEPADYFNQATIGAIELSPDGKRVAYVESRWGEGKEGRKRDLWCVIRKNRSVTRLTFDGFGASQPHWSPDGKWIYFAGHSERPGSEQPPYDGSTQIWRVSPGGGDLFPVTRIDGGIKTFTPAPDGRHLYYTVGEEVQDEEWRDLREEFSDLEYGHGVGERDALWKLDLVGWRAAEILPAERVINELSLAPNGRHLAMITTEDEELIFVEGRSRVDILDLDSGEITQVTSQEWRADHPSPYGWLEDLAWSGDSAALAFSISYDGYAARIYVAEAQDHAWPLRLIARPEPVDYSGDLRWRGDRRILCYRGENYGRIRVMAVADVELGANGETVELTPDDVVVSGYAFSANGKTLVTVFETTTQLNDIFELTRSGKYERLTTVNPQVERWILPQIEDIAWRSDDGTEVHGILELPAGYDAARDGPLPLIVELHGGPSSSTKYRLRMWIYGRALMAANGYALLSPNYRGSTGYGDTFLEQLIGRENDIEVADILSGLHHVIDQGIADPERIGVMGWSNGGYLTNCLITAAPEMFKAASSGASVLDMVIQWGTEDTPGHVINFVGGLPWEVAEHYKSASPLYQLDRVQTPTLIHVGGADPRVPPAHSRALYRALRHYLNVPTELVVYPGEPHGLTTHENRLAKMEWDLAWFGKYLGLTEQ